MVSLKLGRCCVAVDGNVLVQQQSSKNILKVLSTLVIEVIKRKYFLEENFDFLRLIFEIVSFVFRHSVNMLRLECHVLLQCLA